MRFTGLSKLAAWSVAAVLVGIVFSAGIVTVNERLGGIFETPVRIIAQGFSGGSPYADLGEAGIAPLERMHDTPIAIPAHGKAVRIDAEHGALELIRDGAVEETFALTHIPEASSPWFAPAGVYTVEEKTQSHESLLAFEVWNYAIHFSENAVVHAPDVVTSGEGNGFELAAPDAARVFAFADVGTPLLVVGRAARDTTPAFEKVFSALTQDTALSAGAADARAFLVRDTETGDELFARDADTVYPIASISKLVTALTAYRLARSEIEMEGKSREELDELVYTMLLRSSNTAARRIADLFGRERFVSLMEETAREIGMRNTSFADASGLSAGNTSTARDLALLIEYLDQNEREILDITELKTHTDEVGVLGGPRVVVNHNARVRTENPYFAGGKDGYTPEALQTSVSLFDLPITERKRRRVSVVVLGTNNRSADLATLARAASGGTAFGIKDFKDAFAQTYAMLSESEEGQSPRVLLGGDVRVSNPSAFARALFSPLQELKARPPVFLSLSGITGEDGYQVGEDGLRLPPEVAPELVRAGVDAVALANAHAGDWGRSAFGKHVATLKDAGLGIVGGGDDGREAHTPFVAEHAGAQIGFLSFSDAGPDWLSQDDNLPVILSTANKDFRETIRAAARSVDQLVVGIDFDYSREGARGRAEALGRVAIDAGARVVAGYGATEAPLYEHYKNGVIFYGLGTLADIGAGEREEGMLVEVQFSDTGVADIRGVSVRTDANGAPAFAFE